VNVHRTSDGQRCCRRRSVVLTVAIFFISAAVDHVVLNSQTRSSNRGPTRSPVRLLCVDKPWPLSPGAALGTTPTGGGGSSLSSSPTGGLMIGLEGAQSAHAKGMWGRVQGGVRPLLPRGYNHRKIFKIKHRKSCSFMHSGLHRYGLLTYYSGRNRQWRGHGGFGGFEPPTCLQDDSWDSYKTAEKIFWDGGRGTPLSCFSLLEIVTV
jgi:hypothetical protein